jgi:hypothetical protein
MSVDTLPPGETGPELPATAALGLMGALFALVTLPARLSFGSVKDIDVRKAAGWVLITVKYRGRDANEVTFRVRRAWAQVLLARLQKVLG